MNQFNSVAEPTFDLEANVLGSMTLNNKNFNKAQENGLMPSDFTNPSFKKAYEVMIEKQTSDIITLQGSLKENHFHEVRMAAVECISTAGFSHWLKLMHENTSNRKLLNLSQLIPNIVDEDIKIEEKIDKVNQLLVDNKITKNTGAPKRAEEILDNVEKELEDANEVSKNLTKSGFQVLDNKINGFRPGDLVVVAGRPGMGKTTWALNVATHNLLKDKTVLVFSLEMTNEQLLKKIISADARLTMDSLLTGSLDKEGWQKFKESKEKLKEKDLYIYDKSPITIETLINKTKAVQAVREIDLIVVDYLQLLMTSNKAPSNSDSRAASMSYISNLLKGLAKDTGCPLIALSQLNRGVEARTDKRPVLSDLRDSGSIEQDADMVIMLYREEYYDALEYGDAEIIIRKNRLGDIGDLKLLFDGAFSKFEDPEERAFGRKEKTKPDYGPI